MNLAKNKLDAVSFLLPPTVLLLLAMAYYSFNNVFIYFLILLLLSVLAALTLSDLLITWFLIFSTLIGVAVFSLGIIYLPLTERFLLTLFLPISSLASLVLQRFCQRLLNPFSPSTRKARSAFDGVKKALPDNQPIFVSMVEVAHAEQFMQDSPKAFQQVIEDINRILKNLGEGTDVFYIEVGKFIVLSHHQSLIDNLSPVPFSNVFFKTKSGKHSVQIKSAEERVSQLQELDFETMVKKLERRLESVIVVEY